MRQVGIEYSIVGNHWNDQMGQVGIEYSIVRNHRIKGIRIECLIVRMVVLEHEHKHLPPLCAAFRKHYQMNGQSVQDHAQHK
jgi:hypothetical protein